MASSDKRQSQRLVASIPVIVSPNEKHQKQESLNYYDCYSKDLSENGASIITHEPFFVGEKLEIIIELPEENSRFLLVAEVKWSLEIDDAPTYFTGVHFLSDTESDCNRWQRVFH